MKGTRVSWSILVLALLAIGWLIWRGVISVEEDVGVAEAKRAPLPYKEEKTTEELAKGAEEMSRWLTGEEGPGAPNGTVSQEAVVPFDAISPSELLPDPTRVRSKITVEGHPPVPKFPPGDYHLLWPPQDIPAYSDRPVEVELPEREGP